MGIFKKILGFISIVGIENLDEVKERKMAKRTNITKYYFPRFLNITKMIKPESLSFD
jgi:hypothetical protein